MFGLCFSILARRFAFPLLLELGLGTSCLHLGSLPTDCLVVILAFANATLPALCWAGSLLASTAVMSAAPITLLLALASFATRRCLRSLLRLVVPNGYGICGQGWISIGWCATTTILSPELGILFADTFLTFGLLYQFLPRKVSSFPACLNLYKAPHVKHL